MIAVEKNETIAVKQKETPSNRKTSVEHASHAKSQTKDTPNLRRKVRQIAVDSAGPRRRDSSRAACNVMLFQCCRHCLACRGSDLGLAHIIWVRLTQRYVLLACQIGLGPPILAYSWLRSSSACISLAELGGSGSVDDPRGGLPQPHGGEAGHGLVALDGPLHPGRLALRVLVRNPARRHHHLPSARHHAKRERDGTGSLHLDGQHPPAGSVEHLVPVWVERAHVSIVADADERHVEERQAVRADGQHAGRQRPQLRLVGLRFGRRVAGAAHHQRMATLPAVQE
mmetsp:Transcript_34493/g.111329  ORF Transcript_34493/g.111329 Transcript_34493/m.111329 type:complete len:284 (-) Transcript_34493:410-1261(-)